jgi:hypothetical protein
VALKSAVKAPFDPFRPPHSIRIRLLGLARTPFRTVDDLAQGVQSRGLGGREVGLYEGPLGIGEVGHWYALLMLGRVPSYPLTTPFRTFS